MAEGDLGQHLQSLPAIKPEPSGVVLEEWCRRALPRVKVFLEWVRKRREQLPPEFRRASSAGRLLFQVLGVAGYAGYFVAMHTLMRVVSLVLVSGAWYAIYWFKKELGAG